MFGHMIGITARSAGLLPAHEVALRILAEPVDAVQVGAPLRAGLHRLLADGLQRYACSRVPKMVRFVDPALSLPTGVPLSAVALVIQIDRQVDPVASGRNLELTVVPDVCPIVAQKELD